MPAFSPWKCCRSSIDVDCLSWLLVCFSLCKREFLAVDAVCGVLPAVDAALWMRHLLPADVSYLLLPPICYAPCKRDLLPVDVVYGLLPVVDAGFCMRHQLPVDVSCSLLLPICFCPCKTDLAAVDVLHPGGSSVCNRDLLPVDAVCGFSPAVGSAPCTTRWLQDDVLCRHFVSSATSCLQLVALSTFLWQLALIFCNLYVLFLCTSPHSFYTETYALRSISLPLTAYWVLLLTRVVIAAWLHSLRTLYSQCNWSVSQVVVMPTASQMLKLWRGFSPVLCYTVSTAKHWVVNLQTLQSLVAEVWLYTLRLTRATVCLSDGQNLQRLGRRSVLYCIGFALASALLPCLSLSSHVSLQVDCSSWMNVFSSCYTNSIFICIFWRVIDRR